MKNRCVCVSAHRHGLTIIELLVVVFVIGMLLYLLLPPLAKSRETAYQVRCKDNLRQIGLALHSYHQAYQCFPPGYVLNSDGPYLGWGWGILIMPYVPEGANYFQWIRFADGIQKESKNPNLAYGNSSFRCPSQRGERGKFAVAMDVRNGEVVTGSEDQVTRLSLSPSDYFGVAGYLPAMYGGIARDDDGVANDGKPQINAGSLGHTGTTFVSRHRYCDQGNFGGIFGQNSDVRIDKIRDGLGNVFMVGERATPSNESPGSIGKGTWIGVPDCSTAAGLAAALGDTSVRLNARHTVDRLPPETTGFSSFHVAGRERIQGGHFLLADGSVKFIQDDIDAGVYRDLSTIDDGRKARPD